MPHENSPENSSYKEETLIENDPGFVKKLVAKFRHLQSMKNSFDLNDFSAAEMKFIKRVPDPREWENEIRMKLEKLEAYEGQRDVVEKDLNPEERKILHDAHDRRHAKYSNMERDLAEIREQIASYCSKTYLCEMMGICEMSIMQMFENDIRRFLSPIAALEAKNIYARLTEIFASIDNGINVVREIELLRTNIVTESVLPDPQKLNISDLLMQKDIEQNTSYGTRGFITETFFALWQRFANNQSEKIFQKLPEKS